MPDEGANGYSAASRLSISAIGHCDQSSVSALTRCSMSALVCCGDGVRRKRSVPLDGDEDAYADSDAAPLEDLVRDEGDRARIAEIVAELPDRQQAIIKLRFFFDRAPGEIQRFLGLTDRVYRRELERAMRHIGDRFSLVLSGDFCESRRSVILAYVAGIAGPTRALEARRHLATCRGCAQWAGELRSAAEGLASVLPLPV